MNVAGFGPSPLGERAEVFWYFVGTEPTSRMLTIIVGN